MKTCALHLPVGVVVFVNRLALVTGIVFVPMVERVRIVEQSIRHRVQLQILVKIMQFAELLNIMVNIYCEIFLIFLEKILYLSFVK
jgi:hypothetical protein